MNILNNDTSQIIEPTREQLVKHLRRANETAIRARQSGNHPFGAVLVSPDNDTVLAEQGNVDTLNHAESVLVRTAYTNFSTSYLWGCTLYTTVEPCVMCAGSLYWANIGAVAFGVTERQLLDLTGPHEQNPTLDIPCRYVFEHGQKKGMRIWGPIAEVQEEILIEHRNFWRNYQP